MNTTNSIFFNKKTQNEDIEDLLYSIDNPLESSQIDAEQFFETLEDLLNKLGILSPEYASDLKKIQFLQDYPDELYDDQTNIITYNIEYRSPLKIHNKSVTGDTTDYYRPSIDKEQKNFETGNIDQRRYISFDNTITLTCYSMNSKTVRNMARLMESILIKYRPYFKKYILELIYLGQSGVEVIGSYDAKRFFSKQIAFRILTVETFIVSSEELKSFDITIDIKK